MDHMALVDQSARDRQSNVPQANYSATKVPDSRQVLSNTQEDGVSNERWFKEPLCCGGRDVNNWCVGDASMYTACCLLNPNDRSCLRNLVGGCLYAAAPVVENDDEL